MHAHKSTHAQLLSIIKVHCFFLKLYFSPVFLLFFQVRPRFLCAANGKASSTVPLCTAEPNHGEEASRNSLLFKMSLISFTAKAQGCVKLVAIQFWHCYWLFQIKTQQRYKKAVSALPFNSPAIPAGSGCFPVASPVTKVFHLWRGWESDWFFLMLSICKILSLPLFFLSNGV